MARVTWGTTTDALAAAVEAFRAAAGCRVGWLFEVEIHIFEVENRGKIVFEVEISPWGA